MKSANKCFLLCAPQWIYAFGIRVEEGLGYVGTSGRIERRRGSWRKQKQIGHEKGAGRLVHSRLWISSNHRCIARAIVDTSMAAAIRPEAEYRTYPWSLLRLTVTRLELHVRAAILEITVALSKCSRSQGPLDCTWRQPRMPQSKTHVGPLQRMRKLVHH